MSGRKAKPPTPAWNWKELEAGTAAWRAAFEDLGEWVRWYTKTYELWQSMPVCWYHHSRLVEELRALRFHHESACESKDAPRTSGPSARAYSEWMTSRRDWERIVLGLDPREHGGCSGLTHSSLGATTENGRADRLRRMADGLTDMLDTTVPGDGRQGT